MAKIGKSSRKNIGTGKDFPVQQGSLDFLCSVYAALNAMDVFGKFAELDDAAEPFQRGIHYIYSTGCLPAAICAGIDEHEIPELLNAICGENWDHFTDPYTENVQAELVRLLDVHANPVIVSLITKDTKTKARVVGHYTVVKEAIDGGFTIHDSQRCKEIQEIDGQLYYQSEAVELGYIYWMDNTNAPKT